MAKVYSPNKNYNGITATIGFVNGVGETKNKYLLRWFKEHGYKVEEKIEVEENIEVENENIKTDEDIKNEDEKEIDYTSLSYQDLKKIASKKNINSFKVKKKELIEKLENFK